MFCISEVGDTWRWIWIMTPQYLKRSSPKTHETKVDDEYIDKYVYICYTPGEVAPNVYEHLKTQNTQTAETGLGADSKHETPVSTFSNSERAVDLQ